jgi:hypothetical protein
VGNKKADGEGLEAAERRCGRQRQSRGASIPDQRDMPGWPGSSLAGTCLRGRGPARHGIKIGRAGPLGLRRSPSMA